MFCRIDIESKIKKLNVTTSVANEYVVDTDDSSTSFLVNSRTLMECADPPRRRGVSVPHHCPLGSIASYLIYADVRTFR